MKKRWKSKATGDGRASRKAHRPKAKWDTRETMPADPFPVKVDRNVYPRPEYRFPNAKIGLTYETSEPDFPKPLAAPTGSPNVLLVLLDDIGYGVMGTFGGAVESPTLDRLAAGGLRYCQFHTTSLCSPTRAALLTGRNHHSVGSGVIQEQATGYPGYCGIIPKSCATIAELLQENGYATGWWGKNHNVPDNQTSPAGPFDRWPTNMGFDYFYGFISGETDQFYPTLVRNTTPVDPPATPEQGYQLTRDLANDCIAWMREQKSIAPDRPFFAYFSTGAGHAPHHPPLDWRGRHAGKFDEGWDAYRKRAHKKQLELGVIPPDTRLTKRPEQIPAWNDHSADEKRLFSRFFENYADFCEHTDFEVGRLIDALEEIGELDNTLVLYIVGDNGCSAEGTLTGTINELYSLQGGTQTIEEMLPHIDEIGMPGTSPHYPVGWAWAGDAPFKWTKQVASHFGGTRNGMVVHWPARLTDAGGTRFQFHHAIDIAPTILEVAGITEPSTVNGVAQKPIEGVSMAYTLAPENRDAPSQRYMQYFEMLGNRALYNDGWIACCRHGRLPWDTAGSADFKDDEWELYNIAKDFSQSVDLAKKHPDKLRELQDLFMAEAAKYNVLPLDDRFAERLDVSLRPSWFYGRKQVTFYPGMVRLPEGSGPKTVNVNHTITVTAEIPGDGADGVLVCLGGDTGGWSLYVLDDHLVYHYNYFNVQRTEAKSNDPIPTGEVEFRVEFECESDQPGGPANVRLFVNGEPQAEAHIDAQTRARFSIESLDVGVDKCSPVSIAYRDRNGFPFTGKIGHVTFDFDGVGSAITPEERATLHVSMD